MSRISRLSALVLCAFLVSSIRAAEEKPKAEDLFPESTIAALIIPDLASTRAAAAKTRLAEMYAQPEMQAFLAPALGEIRKTYGELRKKNPLLPAPEDIDSGLFGSEIAACVYTRQGNPPVGVVVTLAPKDPEAFKRLLPQQLRQMLVEGLVMPLGGNDQDGSLAYSGGRIVLCVPQSDVQPALARMKDAAARATSLSTTTGFKAVRAKLAASAVMLYAAPQKTADAILASPEFKAGGNPVLMKSLLKSLGVSNVNGVGMGMGFSSTDPILEAFVSFTAPPDHDLFSLCATQTPISAEALKIAPADAPFVAGSFIDLKGILPFVQSLTATVPDEAKQFEKLQAMSRQVLGFDLQKDLMENLGGEIVTTQTSVDTGVPLSFAPGLVISIPAKDPAKVEECLQKLGNALNQALEMATQQNAQPKELVDLIVGRFLKLDYKGKHIYYLTGQSLGSKLAMTVIGNRLLVCTSYNAAKRGIEQLEANTDILSNKGFQETIARLTGKPFDPKALPASFGYSIDKGSGSGTLLITALGLSSGVAAIGGLAEIPAMPGEAKANGDELARNETAAIGACKAFAEAEEIYHRTDYTGNGVLKYSPALQGDNSLLEQKAGAGDLALIDRSMGQAEGDPGVKTSKHGYRFKVLKAQGSHATGGAKSYVVDGNMTLGYALLAYPAEYGVSGKQTFMINSSGVVFSKDLGAGTAEAVKATKEFDPDNSWAETNEEGRPAIDLPRAQGNEFEQFIARPSGKAVLAIANTIDLGLWPDEGFFIKYRQPKGALATLGADGIYWRSELPPPGPVTAMGINPTMVVAGTAIVAAIAIPSLLRSRMAANETAAAACCKAYAEAQEIYHRTDYNKDGVLEYAQTMRDLLETKPGTGDLALIDRTMANAEMPSDKATPKAGYLFKVLKAQGAHATGGQRNYVVNGHMTLGYAFVAYPAAYDSTGRDTFIINNNGTIFQKDLGADTARLVDAMTEFDPDDTWVPTQ